MSVLNLTQNCACTWPLAYSLLIFATPALCFAQDDANSISHPTTVTVGDPQTPDGLNQALQDAYKTGAHHIIITPGTYLLSSQKKPHLLLKGWMNTVITATGVNLVMNNPDFNDRLFDFEGCANVTLEGANTTQTTQTAYQGHVTAIGRLPDGSYTCDWTPSPGYPIPPDESKIFGSTLPMPKPASCVPKKVNSTMRTRKSAREFFGTTSAEVHPASRWATISFAVMGPLPTRSSSATALTARSRM